MAAVTLEHVSKRFQAAEVLRDVSLEIAHGELLVVVGPSGSGKSTILRLVAGLDAPTSGRVLIAGDDVTDVPPQERDVAMVFQSYALYPHMTVRENLGFGLRMRNTARADIDAAVRRTADMLGLAPLLERRPAQLSGGQRQRVAVGRALAREARAYLLDEPLSNLDPLLRVETRTELGLLHRRLGATMLYVTHDQEEAMTLGTRIAVMRDGALEQVGAPLDLYQRPANRFVASFMGTPSINVIRAGASRDPRGWTLASRVLARPLTLELDARMPDAVDFAFRAQDATLCAPADADLRGTVTVTEALGPATLLHVRPEAGEESLVRVLVPPETRVAVDELVGLRVRRDRLHLFDSGTGARLD